MNEAENKRIYKVISLLIKAIILILSVWYILAKINASKMSFDFAELFQRSNLLFLFLVLLLMPINWGLEAWKWQILICPLENITFSKSLKSIFSGVTISIFTPNRVGEFAGRIFFLEKADKIVATLKSFIGSAIQLFVTICAGLVAFLFYNKKGYDSSHPILTSDNWNLKLFLTISCLFVTCIVLVFIARKYFFKKIKDYLKAVFEIKKSQVLGVLVLSILRYFIFSVQYYLALKVFNLDIDFTIALMIIAITFLVTSAIPTFAISEITVRGATAVYFFSTVTNDSTGVVAASLLLWIINLAIPALIGEVFIWKLKFFNNQI